MENSPKSETTQEDSQSNSQNSEWVFVYWDDIDYSKRKD